MEGVLYALRHSISSDRGRCQTKSLLDAKRRLRSLLRSCGVSADAGKSKIVNKVCKNTSPAHLSP